jgi:hypothetical protein
MKLRNTILLSTLLLVTGTQANAATTLELEERIAKLEAVLAHIDADQDNFSPNQGDCDDSNSDIHPEANEYSTGVDGIDNDCDGTIDEDDYYEASSANEEINDTNSLNDDVYADTESSLDDSYTETESSLDDSTSYSSSNSTNYVNDDSYAESESNETSYSNDDSYAETESSLDDSTSYSSSNSTNYVNDDSYAESESNGTSYSNDDSYAETESSLDDSTSYSSSNSTNYVNDDGYAESESNETSYSNDDSYAETESSLDGSDSYINSFGSFFNFFRAGNDSTLESSSSYSSSYDNDNAYGSDDHEVKGRIISLSSNLMTVQINKIEGFRVSGNTVTIDFRNARFKNGNASKLSINRNVKVEGYWTGTVLVASKVKFI